MSSSVVSSFGGSFFKWFQDGVLPYLLGTVILIVVIVSCSLNILLIVTLKKRDMMKYPCNRFVLELSVMDLLAVALILLPSMVAAFSKTWYFTDYFCYVHGGLILWFHLVTFGLLSVMFVERMVKITNTNLYAKVFTSSRVVTLLSALVWVFTLLVTGVSASPWLTISYNFYHAACAVNLDDNIYYTSIVIVLGMVASLIVCIVCIVKIFMFKKQAAEKANNDKKNSITSIKEEPGRQQ
nr:trace amine-associated receptor 3-like [Crassostrea gigas]